MVYPLRRKSPQWRRVRGRRIHGVLFEIDTRRGVLRFQRGRKIEMVNLCDFGLRPAERRKDEHSIYENESIEL